MRITVIIPALNEEATVGAVVQQIPRPLVDEVIVVDNASTDATAAVALASGARVVREERRGYGFACLAGATAAQGDALVFLDGDGSFDATESIRLVAPLLKGEADLVLGSRELGAIAPGAMPQHQRFGNWLAVKLLRSLYDLQVTDLGPFRSLLRDSLFALCMSEMTYGWPIEMMVKAARFNYRVVEVPVSYYPRLGGRSKVSGTVKGSIAAGYHIMRTIWRHARPRGEESLPDE